MPPVIPETLTPCARHTYRNLARSGPLGGTRPRPPGTSTAAVPQPRRRRAAKRALRLALAVPGGLRCYHTDPRHHLRRHPASLKATVSDSRAKESHQNPSSSKHSPRQISEFAASYLPFRSVAPHAYSSRPLGSV